jgi:serine/threonine protein kinase
MNQMLQALIYLSDEKIIHRDVKPDNILFDVAGEFYLADFGLSKDQNHTKTVTGSPDHMAPESFTHLDQTPKLDVWSLGIVALEVLNDLPPCHIKHILEDYATWHSAIVDHVTQYVPQLKPMLCIDSSKRYSAKQCAQNIFHASAVKKWITYVPGLHDSNSVPVTGLTTMMQAWSPFGGQDVSAEIHPFRQFGGGAKSKPSASSGGRSIGRTASAMDWQPESPAPLPQRRRQAPRQPSQAQTITRQVRAPQTHTTRERLLATQTSLRVGSPMQLVTSRLRNEEAPSGK